MYQTNVYILSILIIAFFILLLLISIHYSIGLAQTSNNSDLASLNEKGAALGGSGKYEEAITYYDRALSIDPNYTDALIGKGAAIIYLGRYQEGITYYDRALKIEPKNVYALTNKGAALNYLGRYQEAISYYDRALEIDPKNVYALTNKGAALNYLGRYQEAISYFDRALDIKPDDARVLNNKGNALNNLGRYQEAIEYYDKALGSKPIENIHYSTKGMKTELDYISVSQLMTFIDFNGYKEFNGLRYIALTTDSETTIIVTVNKGIALYKIGRYQDANDNFDKVLKMNSKYVPGLYYKGLCLEKLGQSNQAISYKNKAAVIDPTYKGELIDIVLTQSPLEQLFSTR